MSESLFSPQWYRVADLHPALRSHVKLHRQVIREKTWYLLEDTLSGRQHRLDAIAYGFIAQLDGRFTVHELWLKLLDKLKDDAPSQYDILRLVGQLHQADLVQCEITPDIEELFSRQERRQKKRRWGMVNPLAFRTPLFNPAGSLNRIYPFTRWIFTTPFALFLIVTIILGAMAGLQHFNEISQVARVHMTSPRYWLIAWLVFPVMKVIHEYAHALTVRHWGGKVHELGITLMLLMPVPYVDASAANLFASKKARILVSAAGILAEALLASIALLIWLNIEDSLLRDIMLTVVLVGAVSTLLFNGNPLVKFDGYHVLADAIEIPNLIFQSRRYWSWLARYYLLRIDATPPEFAPQERKWLLLYGPASWFYRLVLMLTIGGWLLKISPILAISVCGLFAWSLFVQPLYQMARYFQQSPEISHQRSQMSTRVFLASGLIMAVLILAPFPYASTAEGVVWASKDSRVRVNTDGFVRELNALSGQTVDKGELILTLSNEQLETELRMEQAKLAGLRVEFQQELMRDRNKSAALREDIRVAEERINSITDELTHLQVRAPVHGVLHIEQPEDLTGRLLRKGQEVAYVFPANALQVRTVVDQRDIALVREKTREVEIRLAAGADKPMPARVSDNGFTPTNTLPSEALGFLAGGQTLTKAEDEDRLETVHPVFLVDLKVDDHAPLRYGERAWVRFNHGYAPLAQQWVQSLRQLFLKHTSTST